MRLKTVFIRFYKSFNFDYLQQINEKAKRQPWDDINGNFYPYVQIPIEPEVTTVVGANESGKSHFLSAIKKGLTGKNIQHEDFCRYSDFFTVKQNELRFPDFGYEFEDLSVNETQRVRQAAGVQPEEADLERFFMFRNQNNLTIYLPGENQGRTIKPSAVNFLPRILDIKANIAVPDSVPIERIIEKSGHQLSGRKITLVEQWQREKIDDLLDAIADDNMPISRGTDMGIRTKEDGTIVPMFPASEFYKIPIEFENDLEKIKTLKTILNRDGMSKDEHQRRNEEFKLAYQLICEVARVDADVLVDLINNSLKVGKEGYTGAIIDRINKNLEESLNFPNWWVQDRNFRLVVSVNNYHLKFAIRDRTGTTYSFSERSSGLRYFLSYYIQYKAHNPDGKTPEILLMDEPDAYLSSQAQQDLLRIFEAFAKGQDGRNPVQVVYVTHSPFLIDKNHPKRIRVVEKGVEDEGTRLVKDVDKNHYEPLRSAFGAFVGETTFIGNCNLMVEGLAEQILLAGAATYLRHRNVSELEILNLNHITIIPTEGASHIPYLAYLARGQGVELPAVILLLDSDQEGNDAKKLLKKSNLVDDDFILQIGELAPKLDLSKCLEMEDIIPLSICVAAAKRYAKKICNANQDTVESISETTIQGKLKDCQTVFQAIEAYFQNIEGLYIEDVGFARNVIETVYELSKHKDAQIEVEKFEKRFKLLFTELNDKQRKANEKLKEKCVSEKIVRSVDSFILTHKNKSARWEANELISRIKDILDNSKESKEAKSVIQKINSVYELDKDMSKDIDNYGQFKKDLERIKYAGRIASQENDFDLDSDRKFGSDLAPHSHANSKSLSKPKGKGFTPQH